MWLWLATALFVGAAVLSAIGWGRGGRGEFSPDTLQCRVQSEYLVPLLDVPVWQSSFQYYRPELVEYLVAEGFWKPTTTTPPRWLNGFRWNKQWRDGYARFYKELGQEEIGIAWTKANPELATVMWPNFLDLLRQNKVGEAEQTLILMRYNKASIDDLRRLFKTEFGLNLKLPESKIK